MWNVKAKLIPVVIGATGTISESLGQYLSNIVGKHEIKEIQKQPYWPLHTYYGKYVKVQNIPHGLNNITCNTSFKYKTAAKLYAFETCFV